MCDCGVVGLGVMGCGLARNIESRGFSVAVWNLDGARTDSFVRSFLHPRRCRFVAAASLPCLCGSVARRPVRVILLVIKAGRPVDDVISVLARSLERGDVIVDCGNSHFRDTERRCGALSALGISFVGCGVSGGAEGALRGPSLMPGGSAEAWVHLRPLLTAISARDPVDGSECCVWVGPGGSGSFVKMAHNGIEYADMQLICEVYDFLRSAAGMSNGEISAAFSEWGKHGSDLAGYLVQITADILARRDDVTGRGFLVDAILDCAGQKGTGAWMAVDALSGGDGGIGTPCISVIAEAVMARNVSALKDERVSASRALSGPSTTFKVDPIAAVSMARMALLASRIVAYSQGFAHISHAARANGWGQIDLAGIARAWRAGCIIRSSLLGDIASAVTDDPLLNSLSSGRKFAQRLRDCSRGGWRHFVAQAMLRGVPIPCASAALAYYDSTRVATTEAAPDMPRSKM